MHSDWFNGIEILQGRWQHGEKRGILLSQQTCEDILCPAGHERVKKDIEVTPPSTKVCNLK
jgi:hypothetical protein